jgi:hypothetical protein
MLLSRPAVAALEGLRVLFAVDFRAALLRAVDFLAVDFAAVDFAAVVFLAVDFLAVDFLAPLDFRAVVFFAAICCASWSGLSFGARMNISSRGL